MPFFDQHWRLRAWTAALAALAAVLFPVRYLQVAAIWDARLGWDLTPDVIFAVLSALALALVAVLLARSVAPSHERAQLRLAYIEGRESVPREQPEPAPPGEPPLVVVQRIGVFDRGVGCFAALLVAIDVLLLFVIALWAVELLLGASAAQLGIRGARAFVIFIAVLFIPIALWAFGTRARDAVARSPKYTADADRLTLRSRWGRSRTVRWDDARLLEITTYRWPAMHGISTRLRYVLYGRGTFIRIDSAPGFYGDCVRLTDLIEQRTGLEVIDLGKPRSSKPAGIRAARLLARRSGRHHDLDLD